VLLGIIAVPRNTILVTSYILLYKVSILINTLSVYRRKVLLQISAVYKQANLLQNLTFNKINILLKVSILQGAPFS
jgi:hypothetical protein